MNRGGVEGETPPSPTLIPPSPSPLNGAPQKAILLREAPKRFSTMQKSTMHFEGNVIMIWGRELCVLIHGSFAFSFKGALSSHSRKLCVLIHGRQSIS